MRVIFIKNIFLWLWSHSPLLCLSDDKNFATLDYEKIKRKDTELRLSLLNIMLGDCVLYIITCNIDKWKPKLKHVLCLEDLDGINLTDKAIEEKTWQYEIHLQKLAQNELEIEKESLYYHIKNEKERINISLEKLNIYTTIILTVLPLLLVLVDFKKILELPFPLIISVFLIAYSLLNICIYLFRGVEVRGIKKSRFSDLRYCEQKERKILSQYYYDWQQLKYEAQLFVSIVKNLQRWIVFVFALALFVYIGDLF